MGITLATNLRPCYIITRTRDKATKKLVIEERKGLFHTWTQESGPAVMINTYDGRNHFASTYGIVEYEDGKVYLVEPKDIRFCDNEMGKYIYPGLVRTNK